MELPESFLDEMRKLLPEEFHAYLNSFSEKPAVGLRVNTGKISAKDFKEHSPFALTPVPWTENGYYVDGGTNIAKHPWYYAGLYYIQEPSAMLPAALLDVRPGEFVLDLCAAPGGKATELGSRLKGEGFLVANDISHSRAKALLKNLQLHGIGNLCVCSETPEKLLAAYPEYFDKILVDAPCSGEGMFRKDPSMAKAYRERGPEAYAPLQENLLKTAVRMLKPGGQLVYSTCTFSQLENEQVLEALLAAHPEMQCLKKQRLFPHRVRGEGHFAALLEKRTKDNENKSLAAEDSRKAVREREASQKACAVPTEWTKFAGAFLKTDFSDWDIFPVQDRLYALPDVSWREKKLRYLDTGLWLGTCARGRFEPSQALAMFLKKEDAVNFLSLPSNDTRIFRYLKGETVELTKKEVRQICLDGWTLVCTDGYPLGWAKWVSGSLRNKYYAGWRMN